MTPINPLQMLVAALNNGHDPRALMGQMIGQNPQPTRGRQEGAKRCRPHSL